jgi:hypothetical protein
MWKQSRGVSLAEVVLAVGLLTIISITVAGVFIHLLHASAKTSDLTAGRTLARRVLDRAVRAGPPDWGFPALVSTSFVGSQMMTTQGSDRQTEFIYSIEPSALKSNDVVGGVTRQIYYVEVEVKWWVDNPTDAVKSQAELGRLSTTISQIAGYDR